MVASLEPAGSAAGGDGTEALSGRYGRCHGCFVAVTPISAGEVRQSAAAQAALPTLPLADTQPAVLRV